MIREIIMNEHGLVLVEGDVRNRFSWVHLKTVLMPPLITKITFFMVEIEFSGPYQEFCCFLTFFSQTPINRTLLHVIQHLLDLEDHINAQNVCIDLLNKIKT